MANKTADERKAILDRALMGYLKKGWVLHSRGDYWAQVTLSHKKYGCMARLAFGLLLLFAPRRDQVLTLSVNERGQLQKKLRKA